MIAIAIISADPNLRRRLAALPDEDATLTVTAAVNDVAALSSIAEKRRIDVVVADRPPSDYRPGGTLHLSDLPWVAVLDGADTGRMVDALNAGAACVVPRSAGAQEIISAVRAVNSGFVALPRNAAAALLDPEPSAPEAVDDEVDSGDRGDGGRLTPRELEVLAAMADGASNKANARRLGISFHTVKFHVAAILQKLDADTRTEAVIKAAQLGLVML
jgi:DNA-binding NarL/FixJ family response regulator